MAIVRGAVCAVLACLPLSLFAAGSGLIEGTIRDARTGEVLPGANVLIKGTSIGAASDVHGRYVIMRVPPGSYVLRVTYIGYRPAEVPVQVLPDQRVVQDVALEYVGVTGPEVVVTAQAEGQMAAINQQLSSRAIVNVVSSARIQELPDANAAESVARLPGVAVLRSGGEGTKIVIRGLSPKHNEVLVDGVRMASTDFDDRSVDLSMITPYALEGIEVVKAVTPDLDADHIGGSVNFRLREAPPGFRYDIVSQGGYNGLKETYNDYLFVGSVSNRFYGDLLGVFVQASVERRNRSSNEMGARYYLQGPVVGKKNPVYIGGLNLADIVRERSRAGGTFVIDYRLPSTKFVLKNFVSTGKTKAENRGESYNLDDNTHSYTGTDTENKLTVMTNLYRVEQRLPFGLFDLTLSHAYSKNDAPKNVTFTFTENAAFVNVDKRAHPTKLYQYARNDYNKTYLAEIDEFRQNGKDRELAAASNFESDFRLSKLLSGKLRLGGKYQYKEREHDYWRAGGPLNLGSGQATRNAILNAFPWMKETVPTGAGNLPYTLFIDEGYDPGNFLHGDYRLGPTPDFKLMRGVMDVVRTINELETYHPSDYLCKTYDYSGNERLAAGYTMAILNVGTFVQVIPGVRYEYNKTRYTAPQGNSSYTGSDIFYRHKDTTTVRTNEFWLPMFHLRVRPLSWLDLRAAYTHTLSRPDFRWYVPRYNITTTSVEWNNYRLKPSLSKNIDLYLSVHGAYPGLFSVGVFQKRIKDFIFPTGNRVILNPREYNLPSAVKNKIISTYINSPYEAKVKGIEVDWQTNFWYLPGPLKGLVFNINYTRIKSEARYPRTIIKGEYIFFPVFEYRQTNIDTFYTDRLLDQPDNVLNLSLGYDFRGFSARLSMLYQSNIFHGTNFWPELRLITDDYLRWDLSIKQDLPVKGLQLFCNVNNLASALDRDLNSGSKFPAAEQHYGMTVDVGLRFQK
ncbi:MAG: TonB-dependent receptor [candidate division KSB1 bacterium]|nr:TonB-dependent receptor [candidate division KSB1 bacterium]